MMTTGWILDPSSTLGSSTKSCLCSKWRNCSLRVLGDSELNPRGTTSGDIDDFWWGWHGIRQDCGRKFDNATRCKS